MALGVAATAAVAGYVVVAAPRPLPASTPSAVVAPAPVPVVQGPAASTTAVLPRPVQWPELGISTPDAAGLTSFVAATGTTPQVVDVFEPWVRDRPLDLDIATAAAAVGARLSITWEPWDNEAGDGSDAEQADYSLASIIDGSHDAYIDAYARSILAFGRPVTIRLMHEMNGNWYAWGSGVNGNSPGEYVAAWRHVHDRFTALGVRDVSWMWAPNALYTGGADLAPLYPGDAYVDEVGVSNYNWGARQHDGFATSWRTFDSLFDDTLAALRAITDRPVWVAETASSNAGGSKAQWLADAIAELTARGDVAGLIWFDQVDDEHGVDWRIETEPDAAAAWATAFDARPTVYQSGRIAQ